jgi:DNA-directed RNA polymerase specialized sigma54-like protein
MFRIISQILNKVSNQEVVDRLAESQFMKEAAKRAHQIVKRVENRSESLSEDVAKKVILKQQEFQKSAAPASESMRRFLDDIKKDWDRLNGR